MQDYSYLETDSQVQDLIDKWEKEKIETVAMDFEGESNLHIYGLHLCIIQLFDGKDFYIIDALKVSKDAISSILQSDVQKIMFDCVGDSALVRHCYNIEIKNVFDLRVIALALGFINGLSALIERNLSIPSAGKNAKKNKQMANWLRRPIAEDQIAYALDDVRYLFDLKKTLLEELSNQPSSVQKQVAHKMKNCTNCGKKEKPEWERVSSYKHMSPRTKVFLRNIFIARDAICRERNCSISSLIDKPTVIKMAYAETYEGFKFLKPLKPSEMEVLKNAFTVSLSELQHV